MKDIVAVLTSNDAREVGIKRILSRKGIDAAPVAWTLAKLTEEIQRPELTERPKAVIIDTVVGSDRSPTFDQELKPLFAYLDTINPRPPVIAITEEERKPKWADRLYVERVNPQAQLHQRLDQRREEQRRRHKKAEGWY